MSSVLKMGKVDTHMGTCDASASVEIGEKTFVVADDEDNILRVYRLNEPSPIKSFDISKYFQNNPKNKETDIEGAARIGSRIYWITSHGRNKKGELDRNRCQFFATELSKKDGEAEIGQYGSSYTGLVEDLLQDKRLAKYDLGRASTLAPKAWGALNIEGLSATKDGKSLLIGFRNPVVNGKALVLPLLNPAVLVEGSSRAIFGAAIDLDLMGLGIREIQYWPERESYVIVAGHHDELCGFRIFQWAGEGSDPEELEGGDLQGINPEGILILENSSSLFHLISDDGTRMVDGVPCKDLPADRREFRRLAIEIVEKVEEGNKQ